MPGFLETSIHTGYGFLDPYVEKARTSVPLFDRVAKKAEVYVPPLITRVDTFAEPSIEKMKPYIEPRIEQVKEAVTPYVDQGVKKYETVREEGVKYYTVAQDKVDKVKVYQKDKMEQINVFKKDKMEQIKEYKGEKLGMAKEFKDAKVEKFRTLLSKKGGEINMIFRVPATEDVEGLKYKTTLGKVDALLKKAELLVDKYLPAAPSTVPTEDAAAEPTETGDSYILPRMFSLSLTVQTRLMYAGLAKGKVAVVSVQQLKLKFMGDTKNQITKICSTINTKFQPLVDKTTSKVEEAKAQVMQMMTPRIATVKKTAMCKQAQLVKALVPKVGVLKGSKVVKKAVEVAQKTLTFSVETCEKTLGKEKTGSVISKSKTMLDKVDGCLPASVKEVLAAPAPLTKQD